MIRRVLGVLIFVAIVLFTLWLSWPPTVMPEPVSYACDGGDTLTVQRLDTASVQLTRADRTPTTLRRTSSEVGTTYRDSASGLVLWAKGPSAVLHRGPHPVHHGCTALDAATESQADTTHWYGGPLYGGTWWFALRHGDLSRVRREKSSLTQFLYAGPNNEPPALTDGFSFTVGLDTRPPGSTLDEYATSTPSPSPLLTSPRETSLGDRPAVQWQQESGLGGVLRRWAVALSDRTVATVTTSTVGTDSSRYQQRIDEVLESLEFWKRPRPVPADTTVALAMLTDPGDPPDRGCDNVAFVPHKVPRTLDALTTTLDTLFALDRDSVGGARHFLGRTNETLSFERASVDQDTARIYLSGRLTGLRGVCDNPRARIQIEETVRRTAAIDTVELFLDGTPTNLQPDGRGDHTP